MSNDAHKKVNADSDESLRQESLRKYREQMFGNEVCRECNNQGECTKGDGCYYKKAKAALDRAHEIRKFEIGLLWERAKYVATFQTFLFAALGVSFSVDDPKSVVYILRIIICIVGVYSSFFWCLINKGSKFWHENWERHIDFLEDEFDGRLHKTVLHEHGRQPYSVSRVNISISRLFFVAWFALLMITSVDSSESIKCYCYMFNVSEIYCIILLILMTLAIIVSLMICRRALKTKFRNRGKDGKIHQINRELPKDIEVSPLRKWTIYGGIARCRNKIAQCWNRVARPCTKCIRCRCIRILRSIRKRCSAS